MKNNKTDKTAQPERMNLESLDVAAEKRDLLRDCIREAFPEALSNGKVDLERLKLALGEHVETGKERFGLNWHGKAECMKVIQQPSVATLKPSRDESVNFDETENLFIEGDNLEVLKLLQKSYFGKVKMIYIDPPYNTGKEFIYPDKYGETLDTYLEYTGQKDGNGRKFSTNTETSGRYHSRWLSMMYPRLYLAKNLLREDGVIFISIDDNEQANLKALCNQIFGEENFAGQFIWKKKQGGGNDSNIAVIEHEYVIAYCKAMESFILNSDKIYELKDSLYPFKDENGEYGLVTLDKSSIRFSESLVFEIKDHKGKSYFPRKIKGKQACWRWSKKKVEKQYQDLVFKKGKIYTKYYRPEGVTPKSLLVEAIYGRTETGNDDIKDLFGNKNPFSYPKPVSLIKHFAAIGTSSDDIILDFFAGSCTVAHAIMQLNKEDGGNRRFICIQLPEPCIEKSEAHKAEYKTIADIGKERIRRAAKKIEETQKQEKKEKAGEIDFSGGDSAKQSAPLDFGFKAFKLASSNFKIWDGHAIHQYDKAWKEYTAAEKQVAEETLLTRAENHVEHTMPNSAPEDILYEILLKAGYPLTARVEELVMAGKKVFSIDDKNVLICLDGELNQAVIDAMAKAKPRHVVFLDAGFRGNDQLKANAAQAFKARAQEEDAEIVFRTV